ncbi:hypothetical protein [Bacillus pseudomycoides]|uniref:hypothetical protein n=1 Tax=Bacillus pseudomycoides TaxID=64104 RepID=UPI000BF22C48|nr:hypothetical protein [Bacillus pseudomycoides]PEM69353.1 hypothetical protein CN619_21710 [Bacillus pseudomycoides]PGA62175.1 hypothetical protein COL84_13445 [Bacillus pseudomycoides]
MFYTVTANFDMAQYGDLVVEQFLELGNAIDFAKEQKTEFLNQIPSNGALDEEDTMSENYGVNGQHYFFYGVSEDGENFVTIRVVESKFKDRSEAEILVED